MRGPAHFLPVWTAVARQMTIRPASLWDVPELLRRFARHYPGRATPEKLRAGTPWLTWCVTSPERLVLIGPNSFGIAQIGTFYGCERRASLDVLCASPVAGAALESLRLVRKMVTWARRNGAQEIKMDADTGVDFAPFARRLGARTVTVNKFFIPT